VDPEVAVALVAGVAMVILALPLPEGDYDPDWALWEGPPGPGVD
jgi:hypothetical protein